MRRSSRAPSPPVRCEIRGRIDVFHAQRRTKLFAAGVGFPEQPCQELAIVASELSSNIVKYGNYGFLELSMVQAAPGKGIALVARDWGPPFRNLEIALLDGCNEHGPIDPASILKRGGIGAGLGAVLRLTHHFAVEPEVDGKRVIAIRYLGRPVPRWPDVARRDG